MTENTTTQLKRDILDLLSKVIDARIAQAANQQPEPVTANDNPPPLNPKLRQVTLLRIDHGADCTLGVILIDGRAQCVSLELPWRDNQRNVSCIPPGRYICKWVLRADGVRRAYEVTNVPGRSAILFHPGNTVRDIAGCILPGSQYGTLKHSDGVVNRAVLQSRVAQDAFDKELAGKDFELNIINF